MVGGVANRFDGRVFNKMGRVVGAPATDPAGPLKKKKKKKLITDEELFKKRIPWGKLKHEGFISGLATHKSVDGFRDGFVECPVKRLRFWVVKSQENGLKLEDS